MMDSDEYCSGCAKDVAECECGKPPSVASAGSPLMMDMALTVKGFVPHLIVFRDSLLVHGIDGVGNANHFITEFSDLLMRFECGER